MVENCTDEFNLSTKNYDVTNSTANNETTGVIYNRVASVPMFMIVYSMILLFAVVGNGLVCYIVKVNKSMHNVTNYLLVNLAISDLIQAMSSIFTAIDFVVKDLNLGDAGCKLQVNMLNVPYATSVFTLVIIAYERYYIICKPMGLQVVKRRLKWIIPLIWVVSIFVYLPSIYYCGVRVNKNTNQLSCDCHNTWPSLRIKTIYGIGIVVLLYVLPLAAVLSFYSAVIHRLRKAPPGEDQGMVSVYQSRRKVVKMVTVIMVVFFLSWTPYNVLYFLKRLEVDFRKVYTFVWYPSLLLAFLSCAVNPVIYCFLSKTFRDGFKSALCYNPCCRLCRVGRAQTSPSSSRSTTSRPSTKCTTLDNVV